MIIKIKQDRETHKHKQGLIENEVKGWFVVIQNKDKWNNKTSFYIPIGKRKTLWKRIQEEARLV